MKKRKKRIGFKIASDVTITAMLTPANGEPPYEVTVHKSRFLAGLEDDLLHVTEEGRAFFAESITHRLEFWDTLEKMAEHDLGKRPGS